MVAALRESARLKSVVPGTHRAEGRAVMHQIAFATKRAFHGILRATRNLFAAQGLTAACFDLLHALVGGGPIARSSASRHQSTLWKQLGVTAPVVSRMLGALERLGWIRREKDHRDPWGHLARQRRADVEPDFAARAALPAAEPRDAEALAADDDGGVLVEAQGAVAAEAPQGQRVGLDLRRRLHLEGARGAPSRLEPRQRLPRAPELLRGARRLASFRAR